MEGLIYGGKFGFQNRLFSFIVGKKFTLFALFYFVFEGNFQVQAPPPPGGGRWGGLYLEGQFNRGFFAIQVSGLVSGGAYFWNFMVVFIIYFVFLMMSLLFFMIYHGIIFVIDTGHHKIDFLSFSSHLLVHCICHHQ